ncbi:MAG: C-GCAxxG-C-C family protein [Lachnospiraceae bacterium]|nr:C-GCAxxG-C-C family protein [Lachnospiraceae bacterium]
MSKYEERAKCLRADETFQYNCAQAVIIPFAEDAGLTEEAAQRITANFGGGMKRAATCGSIAGGLMVLGLFGVDDPKTVAKYYAKLKERHQDYLDCANLLRLNKEQGGEKKPHCDAMVYECVELVEEILGDKLSNKPD